MQLYTKDSWDGTPLTPNEATEHIRYYTGLFGPQALLLAAHIALAEQFRPYLVALIRLNFLAAPYKFDTSLDAHVLFGPLTCHLGNDIYEIDKNVRWHLITALKQWQRKANLLESSSRVKQVSHLIRQYVNRTEKYEMPDVVDEEYLNRIEWVALAYEDPLLAAEELAIHLGTAADAIGQSKNQSNHILSFTKLRPLVELPLSPFTDILDSSHLIESLLLKEEAKANSYACQLPHESLTFGQTTLPSAQTLLRKYTFSQGFSAASKGIHSQTNKIDKPREIDSFEQDRHTTNSLTDIDTAADLDTNSSGSTEPEKITEYSADKLIDSKLLERWFEAIKKANYSAVKSLLTDHSYLINSTDSEGRAALHYVVEGKQIELLKLLLSEENVYLSCRNEDNNTPLILAASYGYIEITELLFNTQQQSRQYDLLHEVNDKKYNCFHMTIINGHLRLMNWFLEQGVNPNDINLSGESPLSIAVKAGRLALVESLLRYGAKVDYLSANKTGLLAIAGQGGNPNILNLLVELGLWINARNVEGNTPLMFAAYYGQPAALNFLLDRGAEYRVRSAETSTALLFAVQGGHLDNVKRLIQCYPNISSALKEETPGEWNAVRLAALRGYPDILQYLHSLGENLQTVSSIGWNLLHLCCQGIALEEHPERSQFVACLDYLISQGLNINTPNSYGDTPLHIAARQNHSAVINRLVQYVNIDKNKNNRDKVTPFLLAVQLKQIETIEAFANIPDIDFLAQNKEKHQALRIAIDTKCENTVAAVLNIAKVDRNHYEKDVKDLAFWHAASLKHTAIFSLLCKDRFVSLTHRDSHGNQLLHILAKQDNEELISCLLSQHVDVNCINNDWQTPLMIALSESRYKVVTILLQHGAYAIHYPSSANHSPLRQLLLADKPFTDKQNMISLLLSYGADIHEQNSLGQSLLYAATERRDISAIDFLIKEKFNIHETDKRGLSLLHACVSHSDSSENIAIVHRLLDHGIDIDSADENGLTPLHLAIKQGQNKLAEELIRQGADIKKTSHAGWNALHFSALVNAVDVTGIVLNKDPDLLNQPSSEPILSPLQICAEYGAQDVCQYLLRHNADINFNSPDGLPAIFIASKNGFSDIVTLLVNAGASKEFKKSDGSILTLDMLEENRHLLESKLPPQPVGEDERASSSYHDKANKSPLKNLASSKEKASVEVSKAQIDGSKVSQLPDRKKKVTLPRAVQAEKEANTTYFLHTLYSHHDFKDPETDVERPWFKADYDDRIKFLDQINPVDGKYKVSAKSTQVLYQTLPFYQDIFLVRVRDQFWINPRLCIYYLIDGTTKSLFRLNGTSPPIHEVNAKAPIKLDESNILDYMRFFCFFVRGEEGAFYTLEYAEDPNLASADDTQKSIIRATARSVAYNGRNEQGHYLAEAAIAYSNALFIAHFSIQPSGMLEMLDDEPIAADLKTIVDVPIA